MRCWNIKFYATALIIITTTKLFHHKAVMKKKGERSTSTCTKKTMPIQSIPFSAVAAIVTEYVMEKPNNEYEKVVCTLQFIVIMAQNVHMRVTAINAWNSTCTIHLCRKTYNSICIILYLAEIFSRERARSKNDIFSQSNRHIGGLHCFASKKNLQVNECYFWLFHALLMRHSSGCQCGLLFIFLLLIETFYSEFLRHDE